MYVQPALNGKSDEPEWTSICELTSAWGNSKYHVLFLNILTSGTLHNKILSILNCSLFTRGVRPINKSNVYKLREQQGENCSAMEA